MHYFFGSMLIKYFCKIVQLSLVMCCIVIFSSCALLNTQFSSYIPPNTQDDYSQLQKLNEVYKNQYEFELEEELYLSARSLRAREISKEEAIKLYKTFWFENHQKQPRNTTYLYLNIFDSAGKFQFQVYWDRNVHKFKFSMRPYY